MAETAYSNKTRQKHRILKRERGIDGES